MLVPKHTHIASPEKMRDKKRKGHLKREKKQLIINTPKKESPDPFIFHYPYYLAIVRQFLPTRLPQLVWR